MNEFDGLLLQLMAEQQPVGTLERALVNPMEIALLRQLAGGFRNGSAAIAAG